LNKKEIFAIRDMKKFKRTCLYASIFILGLMLFFTGCEENLVEKDFSVVHGLVAEVSARSLTETRWFSLETDGGLTIKVIVETGLGKFTPSHLRSHMITGQQVEVIFVGEETASNVIVAVSVRDYQGN